MYIYKVKCGRGTYVRTVVNDLAIALGTVGHMKKLERTEHGPFQLADCVPLGGLTPLIVRKGLERGEGVMAAFKNKLRLMEVIEQRGNRERQVRTTRAAQPATTPSTPAVNDVGVVDDGAHSDGGHSSMPSQRTK